MNDKEIIKALECCSVGSTCDSHYDGNDGEYIKFACATSKAALALITRQQAEIERLKAKCENTQIGYNFAEDEIKNLKKDKYKLQKALNQSEDYRVIAKAEAVKEFAEALKTYKARVGYEWDKDLYVNVEVIDNLVKEMVGEG